MATNAELARQLAELKAENERLRAEVAPVAVAAPASRVRRQLWRPIVSAVLIVLAGVLTPVAALTSWASVQLSDTDAFVATFAPLADDPTVQKAIGAEVVSAIDENVDLDALVGQLFDGVKGLGLDSQAGAALDLLRGPAAAGAHSLVSSTVQAVVSSPAFGDVFAQALRTTHSQLVAAMNGSADSAIDISNGTDLGLDLKPNIAQVKQQLTDSGIGLASMIPDVDAVIHITTVDSLPSIRAAYGLAVGIGIWLPWLVLALIVAGVFVARKRAVGAVGSGIALFLGGLALAIGLGAGGTVTSTALGGAGVDTGASAIVYGDSTELLVRMAVWLIVLGGMLAVFGWVLGPWKSPSALRSGATALAGAAHRSLASYWPALTMAERPLTTWRRPVVGVVLLGGVAIITFARPLSAGTIVWTIVIGLAVIALYDVIRGPKASQRDVFGESAAS